MTRTLVSNRRRASDLRRLRTEGMTLVEIMIVVIIMALIATAVGVAVLPQFQKANLRQAATDGQSMRSAVQLYYMDNNECPQSGTALQEEGYLDGSKRAVDPWNNEYRIECQGTEILVTSAGPDEQFDTEDDISGPDDVE